MLKFLSISNLAVVSQVRIEFGQGLNVLSGETGAGKSVILSALGLLLGERASQDLIRTGETRASVEGVFEIEDNTPLLKLLAASGLDLGDEDLIIKREIAVSGRGKVFINHQPVTLALLKEIQPHLIDVHGQGEQQSLLLAGVQMNMLDHYAGAVAARERVEAAYEELLKVTVELESLRQSEAERLQALDLIGYQLEEIERARVRPGEDAELEAERRVLANAEKLATLCEAVSRLIYDDDASAVSLLSQAQRRLGELTAIDEALSPQLEQLDAVKYTLDDVAYAVRDYAEKITFSPNRLQEVEGRLIELDRLKRKYGGTLESVIRHSDGLRERRDSIQHSEERLEFLVADLKRALEVYGKEADSLSKLRRAKAKDMEKVVLKELAQVSLERSALRLYFNPPLQNVLGARIRRWLNDDSQLKVSRGGEEDAEFYFSANEGESVKPLSGVASGGELSRLMLVLKSVTAPTRYPRTLIFDEIDSGIGGRVAEAVGVRLKKLSLTNQVLCITHQAQIARQADQHFRVLKQVSGSRTMTSVEKLNQQARIEELARMMAGAEITPITRQHAKEMLRK
jgi:DNA repair protein RecN (Recombination protein N)